MVIFFETLGGTYRQEGDYLLPNIEIPEIPQLGFWGQRRHNSILVRFTFLQIAAHF